MNELLKLPEPVAYVREANGDISNIGEMFAVSNKDECDDEQWHEVLAIEQMQAFATAAAEAERTRVLDLIEDMKPDKKFVNWTDEDNVWAGVLERVAEAVRGYE